MQIIRAAALDSSKGFVLDRGMRRQAETCMRAQEKAEDTQGHARPEDAAGGHSGKDARSEDAAGGHSGEDVRSEEDAGGHSGEDARPEEEDACGHSGEDARPEDAAGGHSGKDARSEDAAGGHSGKDARPEEDAGGHSGEDARSEDAAGGHDGAHGKPEGGCGYGLAVDIGTTTVVAGLYDLANGTPQGVCQERNRQSVMGADVMMRLMHCRRGMQSRLEELIRTQLEEMAVSLCTGICRGEQIRKVVVVGNPTMCHLFLGMDTTGLSGSPFHPAYQGIYRCTGQSLGLRFLSSAEVAAAAGVDAHVGADAAAMMAVLGMHTEKQTVLAVDIGTNAEIALCSQGRLLVCSAPAGPAFEGAQITQGMRGEPGAIAGVRIAMQSGNLLLEVIPDCEGGRPVRGICGSGLIDAVAELRRCGVLSADGYLCRPGDDAWEKLPSFLRERATEHGFVLYQAPPQKRQDYHIKREPREIGPAETETSKNVTEQTVRDVVLTQQDVRQYQLAKAAVQAGIQMLLAHAKVGMAELERIYIAGVFGGHITKANAIRTGLFPATAPEKLVVAGNAAGAGAARALLSEAFLQETEAIGRQAQHVELAQQEAFQSCFLRAMALEPQQRWGQNTL